MDPAKTKKARYRWQELAATVVRSPVDAGSDRVLNPTPPFPKGDKPSQPYFRYVSLTGSIEDNDPDVGTIAEEAKGGAAEAKSIKVTDSRRPRELPMGDPRMRAQLRGSAVCDETVRVVSTFLLVHSLALLLLHLPSAPKKKREQKVGESNLLASSAQMHVARAPLTRV